MPAKTAPKGPTREPTREPTKPSTIVLVLLVLVLGSVAAYVNWPAKKNSRNKGGAPKVVLSAEAIAAAKAISEQILAKKTAVLVPTDKQLNSAAPMLVKTGSNSVVRVFAIKADGKITQGTGFPVKTKNPGILTGASVTADADIIFLESHGKTWTITSWAENAELGLTLIPTVGNLAKELRPLAIPLENAPVPNTKAFTTGYPLGESMTIVESTIWSINEKTHEVNFSGPLSLGMIGGPVADKNGTILAIFTGYKADDQSVNTAITPVAFSLHKDWEKKTTQLTPDGVTTLETALFSVTSGTAQEKVEAVAAILAASWRAAKNQARSENRP